MNISVNYSADVQLKHVEHRAPNQFANVGNTAQTNSSLKNDELTLSGQMPSIELSKAPQTASVKNDNIDLLASQTKTELQVNNTDYKIKMLIDRAVGNNTVQTVLNFYKIGLNESANSEQDQGKKDIDVLA
ncbi:hypothetical protein QX776_13315 [Alteromonadaceae bacterium BrNp21-10]|nr:hypothetical protein [Alteromonadaceae bacterium BrNp21-10]